MLDFSKPVSTRDGRKVRVLCTDAAGIYPVIALISTQYADDKLLLRYDAAGRQPGRRLQEVDPLDLINPPVEEWQWVWRYRCEDTLIITSMFFTEEESKVKLPGHVIGRIQESKRLRT